MILTAILREQLDEALDRFMAKLEDPFSRTVFRRIRATPGDRAVGAADAHRGRRRHGRALPVIRAASRSIVDENELEVGKGFADF